MDEGHLPDDNEFMVDSKFLDIICFDEEPTPLQSHEQRETTQEKDALMEENDDIKKKNENDDNTNKNACREIVIDYSSEFITYEVFKSREALTNWVRDVGRRNGLVIIITSTQPAARGRKAVLVFSCERAGKYIGSMKSGQPEIEEKQSRMMGSKKCECPFRLRATKIIDNSDEWTLCVKSGVHNHPAAKHLGDHSYVGRLNEDEKNLIKELSSNLCLPKDILRTLKSRDERNVRSLKHVYNARHRMKIVDIGKRSQLQYLFVKLDEHKYIEYHRSSGDNDKVIDMFWTHPDCIRLLRTFPTVLIMDCTYKTNKYRIPLFKIVGETSTSKTFMVAIAYLGLERADNYDWVMGRLKDVMNDNIEPPKVVITDREWALMSAVHKAFPDAKQMLCLWHINKNIGALCKDHFPKGQGKQWEKFVEILNLLIKSPNKFDELQKAV